MMRSVTAGPASAAPDRPAHAVSPGLLALGLGFLGALTALLVGLVTFGVQATAEPRHLPLAVGPATPAAAPALAPVTAGVEARGGDAVAWRRVSSRTEAERLLDRKEIYGAVLFSPGSNGLTATVLVSGALNPSATQVALPVLGQVAEAVTSVSRAQAVSRSPQSSAPVSGPAPAPGTAGPAVETSTWRSTSAAGRTLPLAASALLWLATLVTSALVVVLAPRLRGGRQLGRWPWLGVAAAGAGLATLVVLGLARLWDAGLPVGWSVLGFLALVAVAFALLQAGMLRWLGLRGFALLGPLYLTAPAVAGLVPELLHPVYRALLWSWTPFRFSTETLRSLLFLGPNAPDVQAGVAVIGVLGLLGLALMLAPKPSPSQSRTRAFDTER